MEKKENIAGESYVSRDLVDLKWVDVNIPCRTACPIMTDIPGYIQAIMENDYKKAYYINRMDNVLPGVLGRVCHRPCEGVCRHGREGLGDPVSICFLKRSAADYGLHELELPIESNGKKIAIVGAGPAGLTAANDLVLKGYSVTVFEQFKEPGGMLRYGIPQYRLPWEVVGKDVKSIVDLGVEIKTSVRINGNLGLKQLADEYDAVIVAGGCMLPARIDVPGTDAKGFHWGLTFMMEANTGQVMGPVEHVVVVGGGFTSADCCRTAYRIGAKKITLAYRRTIHDLSIGELEIEAMEKEGIQFVFLVSPVAIQTEQGKVTGLELVRNSYSKKNRKLEPIPGSEFVIPADTVIFATGQRSEDVPTAGETFPNKNNVFYAGDFRNGSSTVIEAAADGRKIARKLHQFLSKIHGYETQVRIESANDTGRIRQYDFIPRQLMDEIPIVERKQKNMEVELGFSKDKSLVESRRCYLCHYNFQIDIDRCIYCLACIDVMPVHCIMMVKDIITNEDGSLTYIETKDWHEVQAIAIDNDKCIRCGNCYKVCPVDCISISKYEINNIEKK